jgi:hypothetical protein
VRPLDEQLSVPVGETLTSFVQACMVKGCLQGLGWGVPRDVEAAVATVGRARAPFAREVAAGCCAGCGSGCSGLCGGNTSRYLVRRVVNGEERWSRRWKGELMASVPGFLWEEVGELEAAMVLDLPPKVVAAGVDTCCCVLC